MEITKRAVAGTMESSDIMITLEPHGGGVEIDLSSTVEKQFGREIRRVLLDTMAGLGVEGAKIIAVDRGALNCVIRARLKTAVSRACGEDIAPWGGVGDG